MSEGKAEIGWKEVLEMRHRLLGISLDWVVGANAGQQFLRKNVLKLFSLGNGIVLCGPL